MPVELVAIIYPAPGKSEQVQQLLAAHAEHVLKTEPGCLQYSMNKPSSGSEVIMVETYVACGI